MAIYYGVQRSSEYLAHYGVKGMRWGVRRAKEQHNEYALDRHWRKANRKLERLNRKANWDVQIKRYNRASSVIPQTFIGGASGTVAGLSTAKDALGKYAVPAAIGAGLLGGTVASVIPGVIANNAKKRLRTEGHDQAVKNAHQWTDEMNAAFKGTKYAGKAKHFSDTYLVKRTKYLPEEAKRGNVMPYEIRYELTTGKKLAKEYDDIDKKRDAYRNYLLGRKPKKKRHG